MEGRLDKKENFRLKEQNLQIGKNKNTNSWKKLIKRWFFIKQLNNYHIYADSMTQN